MYLEWLTVAAAAGILYYVRKKDELASLAEVLPTVETERLRLRPWQLSDVEDMYEFAKDPLVGPDAGWLPHTSIEETRLQVEQYIESRHVFAIELKTEGKVIGNIGVYNRQPDPSKDDLSQRALGFVLNPDYWHQGYMTEAVKAVIQYCFNTLELELLWCGHFPGNMRSQKVIQRCGFDYKMTLPVILKEMNNREADLMYYSLRQIK